MSDDGFDSIVDKFAEAADPEDVVADIEPGANVTVMNPVTGEVIWNFEGDVIEDAEYHLLTLTSPPEFPPAVTADGETERERGRKMER